jgi:hypothetical protein
LQFNDRFGLILALVRLFLVLPSGRNNYRQYHNNRCKSHDRLRAQSRGLSQRAFDLIARDGRGQGNYEAMAVEQGFAVTVRTGSHFPHTPIFLQHSS